ncbi:MAG: polyprenol phosphomannose-dependent alpha 1,6 mannosyltransferase MptB [Acidimicrobiia bacterium]
MDELKSASDRIDGSETGGQSWSWPKNPTAALTLIGFVGMSAVALSAALVGPHGPTSTWLERDVVNWLPAGTAGTILGIVALSSGLTLVVTAWIVLGLLLRRGAALRPLVRIAALWSLPLMLGPPIYSRDVYSYAALGDMVNHHLSPYKGGPALLGSSRFVLPVSSVWLHTPSPYGPLFLSLASTAVRVAGNDVVRAVITLRLLEVLGMVLIAVALPTLANAAGKDPARALWLGVCNPLVLLHFIAGAHNDALFVGLIVGGLALAYSDRPGLGVVACILAAAVKATGAIGVAFVIMHAVRAAPRGTRLRTLLRLTGLGAGAFLLATWVTGIGWGWIGALSIPGSTHVLLTPSLALAQVISNVFGHNALVVSATGALGYLTMGAGITYLLWRAPRLGTTRACGLALALVVAAGPVVFPWYALWAVIVLAPAGRRIERGYAIFASVVLTLVLEPSGSAMPNIVLIAAVGLLAAVAIATTLPPVRRWIRNELAPAIDEYRRSGRRDQLIGVARRAFVYRPAAATSETSVA